MLKKIVVIIGVMVVFILLAGYFLLYTVAGNKEAVKYISSQYGDIQSLQIGPEGNIGEGITLKNIELNDLKGLPEGSWLKIQELFVQLKTLSLDGLVLRIENARLKLPESDPILVMGTVEGQALDLDIFSKGITVREVVTYLPDLKSLIPLKGGAIVLTFILREVLGGQRLSAILGLKNLSIKGSL